MARDHARVNMTIWGSAGFRGLSPSAQHLYFVLAASPSLTYVGVADWRPKRIAALSQGWTPAQVEAAAEELSAARVVVVDEDTEEVLVRRWMKYDGLINQPRMAVSVANAYADTSSALLRAVIVDELRRLREEEPDLRGWANAKLLGVLEEPGLGQAEVQLGPNETPDEAELGPNRSSVSDEFGANRTSPTPSPPPSPSPAPPSPFGEGVQGKGDSASAALSVVPTETPKRRGRHLIPDDWEPDASHREAGFALDLDVDAEASKFRDHSEATGKLCVDWSKAFHSWMNVAKGFHSRAGGQPRTFDQIRHDSNMALWERIKREEGDLPCTPQALEA